MTSPGRSAGVDPTVLGVAYADGSKFRDRVALYRHQVPRFRLTDWVLGHAELGAGPRVADVGCGPGLYVHRLRELHPDVDVVALDRSPGMVREAAGGLGGGVAGDATALPFPDAAFPVVIAAHFLYHVPDIPAAVAELRRVLHPGGTLLVVTNGADHHRRIPEVVGAAAGVDGLGKPGARYDLVNGRPVLDATFGSVELDVVRSRIVLTDPEPLVRFVASCDDFYAPQLDRPWPEVLAGVRELVAAEIAEQGSFEMDGESGVFVCRR